MIELLKGWRETPPEIDPLDRQIEETIDKLDPTTVAYYWELFLKWINNGIPEYEALEKIRTEIRTGKSLETEPELIMLSKEKNKEWKRCLRKQTNVDELKLYLKGKLKLKDSRLAKYLPGLQAEIANMGDEEKKLKDAVIDKKSELLEKINQIKINIQTNYYQDHFNGTTILMWRNIVNEIEKEMRAIEQQGYKKQLNFLNRNLKEVKYILDYMETAWDEEE